MAIVPGPYKPWRDAPIFVGNAKAGIAVRRFYAASTFGSIVLAGPYLSA